MTSHDMPKIPEGMALVPRGKPPEGERIPDKESWATTCAKAAKDGPAMDTVAEWKKLIDELPPPLVSIDIRYTMLLEASTTVELNRAHVPFGHVQANRAPWWWPSRLVRANYYKAPPKWLWLGERKPWWFRRWFT